MNLFKLFMAVLVLSTISSCTADAPSPAVSLPTSSYNPNVDDSDCDSVVDALDICPGVNDLVDNNNDGNPDCKYPPGYSNVVAEWKCGSPSLQKVKVCTKTPSGGRVTVCTYYSAVAMHISKGGFLGECKTCNQ